MYFEKTEVFLKELEPLLAKKLIPLFMKCIRQVAKPVQEQICRIMMKIFKLPSYDVRLELADVLYKQMFCLIVPSRGKYSFK